MFFWQHGPVVQMLKLPPCPNNGGSKICANWACQLTYIINPQHKYHHAGCSQRVDKIWNSCSWYHTSHTLLWVEVNHSIFTISVAYPEKQRSFTVLHALTRLHPFLIYLAHEIPRRDRRSHHQRTVEDRLVPTCHFCSLVVRQKRAVTVERTGEKSRKHEQNVRGEVHVIVLSRKVHLKLTDREDLLGICWKRQDLAIIEV